MEYHRRKLRRGGHRHFAEKIRRGKQKRAMAGAFFFTELLGSISGIDAPRLYGARKARGSGGGIPAATLGIARSGVTLVRGRWKPVAARKRLVTARPGGPVATARTGGLLAGTGLGPGRVGSGRATPGRAGEQDLDEAGAWQRGAAAGSPSGR